MESYYLMSARNSIKVASAFAPKGTKLAHELINELDNVKEMPFELDLVKLTVDKEGLIESHNLSDLQEIWQDYLPNSLAWPLMSTSLKFIFEKNLTGNEGIDWISVIVKRYDDKRIYFIPRFAEMLDVLDIQKTLFIQGTDMVIRPVFSLSKISKYSVFHQPSSHNLWKITSEIYVSGTLKKSIQKEKLTGLEFEKTSVATP